QARDLAAGQRGLHAPRRHLPVDVGIAAAGDGEARAVDVVAALAPALAILLVAGRIELGAQGALVERQAGPQLQRTRVYAGRDLPLQRAEALGHLVVEVDRVRDQEARRQRDHGKHRRQQVAAPGRAGALFLAVVVIVFAAWHVRYGRENGRSLAAPARARDTRPPRPLGHVQPGIGPSRPAMPWAIPRSMARRLARRGRTNRPMPASFSSSRGTSWATQVRGTCARRYSSTRLRIM